MIIATHTETDYAGMGNTIDAAYIQLMEITETNLDLFECQFFDITEPFEVTIKRK